MTREFYDQYADRFFGIAVAQHRQSKLFDLSDVEQAIWLHFIERWDTVKEYPEGQIMSLAKQAAQRFCVNERQDYMYFTGQYVYSGDEVKAILEESTWVSNEDVIDIEGRMDVQREFANLPANQQRALFRKFARGEVLDSTGRGLVARGLKRLTNLMNNSAVQKEAVDLEDAALLV